MPSADTWFPTHVKRLFFFRVRNRYFGLVILSLDSLTVSSSRILIQSICPTGRPKFTVLEGLVASAFLQTQGRNLPRSDTARPTLTDLSSVESFFAVRTPPGRDPSLRRRAKGQIRRQLGGAAPAFLIFSLDPYKNLVSNPGFGIPCRRFQMGIDQHSHVHAGLQF